MFPRKSTVLKYAIAGIVICMVLFFWTTNDETEKVQMWRRLLSEMNETEVRQEFEKLKAEVNASFDGNNKTMEEIFGYIHAMKKQVPVNPHYFKYIINPKHICRNKKVFLLTYVHTAPDHYKKRSFIRESWGNPALFPGYTHKVVFLMGKPKEEKMQDLLLLESDRYGDIVQENFIDSYRNLTYKAIMGLKWITNNCNHAKFILKTDDDIFVNIFNLINHLSSISNHGGQTDHLLLCLVWYRMKVMRDPKSKWYLSKEEFAEDYFPTYCSGSAYILSTDVVIDMYNVSKYTPFFWVDDFYVTGLLASKVKVEHQKFNSVYVLGPSTFLDKFTEANKWLTYVFGHVHSLNAASKIWNNILEERKKYGIS